MRACSASWLLQLLLLCIFVIRGCEQSSNDWNESTVTWVDWDADDTLEIGRQRESYLAICSIIKDQHTDVREWLLHHLKLGVSKIYIFDDGSKPPLIREFDDLVDEGVPTLKAQRVAAHVVVTVSSGDLTQVAFAGLVHYEPVGQVDRTTRKPQLVVYNECIARHVLSTIPCMALQCMHAGVMRTYVHIGTGTEQGTSGSPL